MQERTHTKKQLLLAISKHNYFKTFSFHFLAILCAFRNCSNSQMKILILKLTQLLMC